MRSDHYADVKAYVESLAGHLGAQFTGTGLRAVNVSGNHAISTKEVVTLAGVSKGTMLAGVDVSQVRARLKSVALFSEVHVRKLYPDVLAINLVERKPFALWQKEGEVHVIAEDGAVIALLTSPWLRRLPHVVGKGANLKVQEYVEFLSAFPEIALKVRAGMLVDGLRWTLVLEDGVRVLLPAKRPRKALKSLARLDREKRLLSRDVISVDLRFPERTVVRLSPRAAQARREGLKTDHQTALAQRKALW